MKKILIIEDNKEMNRVYERAFRLNGYDVELAYDGESALKQLLASKDLPSAIIMDINMPHMNGYELLKRMKRNPSLKDIPIAILTNSFLKEDASRFTDLGADLYLVKIEQDFTEITGKIDQLIESRRLQKSDNNKSI